MRNRLNPQDIRAQLVQMIPFWLAAGITGVVAVVYAKIFAWGEEFARRLFSEHALWFPLLTPLFFLASWWIVEWLAKAAGGSGIPQMIAAVEMRDPAQAPFVRKLLGGRVFVVKIVSSLLAVMGGGSTGREGPTLQVAGCIFMLVRRVWSEFRLQVDHHSMIVAAGAAGLAAAFNTPLGGIVFVIEELTKINLHNFRTVVIQAVILAGLVAQGLVGPYLYFGTPPALEAIPASFTLFAIGVGIITGVLGVVFVEILLLILSYRSKFHLGQRAGLTVVCGLVCAGLAIAFGEEAIGSGRKLIEDLLLGDGSQVSMGLIGARWLGNLSTYSAGVAGGIFAPALSTGAAIGSFASHVLPYPAHHLAVMVGMVGFLTGVTRTPFTSFVLVLEMTDRHSALFPMMITALTSYTVARLLQEESFYERASQAFFPKSTS